MTTSSDSSRWLPACTIGALTLLVWFATGATKGLLDWDTYERLLFLPFYDLSAGTGDGHVLLHRTAFGMLGLGLDASSTLRLLSALGFGAVLAAATYVARARGLSGAKLAVAVGALAVASPGLTAMVLMQEDNVLYHAPLLLAFHWLTAPGTSMREDLRRGMAAGTMLAVAMLTNITALIFLFLLPLAVVLVLFERRGDALRVAATVATATAVYYLVHATLLAGAPVAMHTFLPQALALQDFGPARSSLLSFQRAVEVSIGFRAMALRPTMHAMAAPGWVVATVSVALPAALMTGYGLLGRQSWSNVRVGSGRAPLVMAAVAAVSLAFPFLYEPMLIERWDMFWLVLWFGLVGLLRRPLPRLSQGALAGVLSVQAAAACLVVMHQVGGLYETEAQAQTRATLQAAQREDADAVVVSRDIDRQHLAHLYFHLQDREVFLVGGPKEKDVCRQEMIPLREVPQPCEEVAHRVLEAQHLVVDARVEPGWRHPAQASVTTPTER